MAKRFTDTDKWKKQFIKGLPAKYKLLWLYILDDCDHAGIWQVDFEVAAIRIGETIKQTEAEKYLGSHIFVFDNEQKWFIMDFIEFQYGTLNQENRAHRSVINLLEKYKIDIEAVKAESVNKPLRSPLEGHKDKDKDKDKEKVNSNSTISKLKREYSELPKTKESIVEFFNSQNKKPLFSEPYMDIYNLFAKEHNYPLIQDITGSRGQKLHTRFADTKFYFLEILKQAKDQDFNVKGNNFLTFDWIIENDNNFRKILDGNYRKKPQLPDTNQQSDQPKRIIEKA